MNRWVRQHKYACSTAARRLLATPFSSLANLLVIALTLALPVLGAALLVVAQPVVKQVSISPEITLFLEMDAPAQAAGQLAKTLQDQYKEDIEHVRIVPRKQALDTLKQNPNWSDALAVLPDNPLPDAVIVTLRQTDTLAQRAAQLVAEWKQLPSVQAAQHDAMWVQRLASILKFLRIGLGLLALGVALVVLATVFNTVRMQALSQREEIAVARLVGATETFVRRPFLYLGAITGIVASALAVVLSLIALVPLNQALATLAGSYGLALQMQLPPAPYLLLATLAIAVLGAIAARWSMTRHSRF
jgi:cell division transport system permease protein